MNRRHATNCHTRVPRDPGMWASETAQLLAGLAILAVVFWLGAHPEVLV